MHVLMPYRVGARAERPLVLTHGRREIREAPLDGVGLGTVESAASLSACPSTDDGCLFHSPDRRNGG